MKIKKHTVYSKHLWMALVNSSYNMSVFLIPLIEFGQVEKIKIILFHTFSGLSIRDMEITSIEDNQATMGDHLVSLVCVHYRCISSKYSEHCLSTCSRR
jgi:hypothetical protein